MKGYQMKWALRRVNLYPNGDVQLFFRENGGSGEWAALLRGDEAIEFMRLFDGWGVVMDRVFRTHGRDHGVGVDPDSPYTHRWTIPPAGSHTWSQAEAIIKVEDKPKRRRRKKGDEVVDFGAKTSPEAEL